MLKPIFVVVEGLDGVGKSTVADLLATSLKAELLTTPPKELSAVRDTIDSNLADIYPARFYYYASTVLRASVRAQELLLGGRSDVMDRYLASTIAYARLGGFEPCRDALERDCLTPDVTLFLTAGADVRDQRIRGRDKTTRIDRDSLERADRLCTIYQAELQQEYHGRVISIDTTELAPKEVVELAMGMMQEVAVC